MQGLLYDLERLELIGMTADAVLVGGCDEGEEPGRVFSYLNLNRAFLFGGMDPVVQRRLVGYWEGLIV